MTYLNAPLLACLLVFGTILSGCARQALPTLDLPTRSVQKAPDIRHDAATGENVLTLKVLSYNVEGLPWPARSGRRAYLEEIGQRLGKMRAEGNGPDIILLQEGFMHATKELIDASGYRNVVAGPRLGEKMPKIRNERARIFDKGIYMFKGEGWGKLYHSGLYILSQFPIQQRYAYPFRFCAGWDCLANKGVVAAEVRVPGLPVPLLVANTHMQASGSSGVPRARATHAHMIQVDETKKFIKTLPRKNMPFIFGGDFNIRNKHDRVLHGLRTIKVEEPYMLVRHYCTEIVLTCDIAMQLEADVEPWRYTQDLQGFIHGPNIKIEPVKLEAVFDGADKQNPALSNHDGYMVTYELRWPANKEAQHEKSPNTP